MELIVVLVIGAPIVLGVWLFVRAVSAKNQIEELTRRVDDLQAQMTRFGKSPAAATEPGSRNFTPAVLPPRKDDFEPPAPPPQILEIPVPPEMQEIPPGMPNVPPAIPPVITPPPIPAFAKVTEPPVAPPETEAAANPPIITARTELVPPPEPPPLTEKASFEMRLGTYWLVRVGIVMLLTGLAFFANYAYHHIVGKLGPVGKISLLYLACGLLLGAGAWWQRRGVKDSLKNYAQVLFAGGLAAVYFTTFAAHHIPPLRVIGNAVVDGTLLLAWAGVIAWIADRRQSEVMALFAVGLAFFTSVITRVGEFTLYSNLILTAAAVVFLVRNRWATLSFASLITSYAGYAFWRFLQTDGWRWATPDENLGLGAGFLACYWLVFTAATFLSRSEKLSGSNRAAFLTLNNGAYFAIFLLTMIQVHTGGFWKFSLGYGAVLLALSALAMKLLPSEPLTKNAYLTQGLLLVTLGFISKFTGLQLALVLGVESVVLFVLGTQRQSVVLKFFGYAAALLTTGWCVTNLNHFDSHGLGTSTGLGTLLVFNAFWAHRRDLDNPEPLRVGPLWFTLLAFTNWLAATWFNTAEANLPLVLAAEAVVLTFSIYLLRVREITLLGQGFLVLAQVAWFVYFLNATPPWWNPLALIVITVGLSHWWQHQKILAINRNVFVCCSLVFALAAVAVVLVWLHPLVSPSSWLALTSLLALAATIYGVATRAWPLAVGGQIFLALGAWEFLQQLREKPEWFIMLAPLAGLMVLSFATVAWFTRQPEHGGETRKPLLQVALVYRWLALALSLLWLWQYVPGRQHVAAFMAAAIGVFALAIWQRNREALMAAAVYAVASLAALWQGDDLKMDAYWANLLSLLALLAMQQILRRADARLPLAEKIHAAIVFTAGVSLWRLLSCWVTTSGLFLTMSWAGFAVVVFALGMFLRERFHRWLGLSVLAAAVGRVVLVDVWKQETIWRVVTFMALGGALLVIGFVYNRYQDTIRKWL